jgi:oligopeptide transport system permease protein
MSAVTASPLASSPPALTPPDRLSRRALRNARIRIGGGVLLLIFLLCTLTLPWTLRPGNPLYFDHQNPALARMAPQASEPWRWFGTDPLGRPMLGRSLLGGAISLTIGLAAAAISVALGLTVGMIAGYRGGWVDALLMRTVDILYGLPYILMVVLLKVALEPLLLHLGWLSPAAVNLIVLFLAIGLVSWLTMARVVRGQVLSLRSQPFIEACRASGLPGWRIFSRHLFPNLIGPVIVYATLTIPQAILQESFLSFLGIGIQAPMPTWGALASEGLLPALNPVEHRWYLLLIPCTLLAVTLLSLNFLGDGLRDVFDPRRDAAKL